MEKRTDPWLLNQDLNTIKVDLNELRVLCAALLKDGESEIGLLDLLFYLRDITRKNKD